MGEVIPFPGATDELEEIDLLSAVDIAIRDLREIAANTRDPVIRRQAAECGLMLGRAFNAALRHG